MYADDVLVTLLNPGSGVPLLMDVLKMYGSYSGYSLNIHKTQALTNLVPTQELAKMYNFNWNLSYIQYLGWDISTEGFVLFLHSKSQPIK